MKTQPSFSVPHASGPESDQTALAQAVSIGQYKTANRVFVAPMAGVTDRPFRQLCKRLGAGYAVSEMAASNPKLWDSVKTARRLNHDGETEPIAVQLAGADPLMMAEAAKFNVDRGAQIIDINMGCPAKKVCNVFAGSALMGDEHLALKIIEAVVGAVAAPVTMKMRIGLSTAQNNAVQFAKNAQAAGAQMITVHGRSRACGYTGKVDYDTIAAVKSALSIPVVANGDIDSPTKAKWVLEHTGADAVMIGRAAQGNPWIFRQIDHFLQTGQTLELPAIDELESELNLHLKEHYAFYGEFIGVRTARKHVGWYLGDLLHALPEGQKILAQFYAIESIDAQQAMLTSIFNFLRTPSQPSAGFVEAPSVNSLSKPHGEFQECWKQVA